MQKVVGIKGRELDEAMHLAEGFRRMVTEQAFITWRKLPTHTRAWLSVEDIVEDSMRWAAMEGVPKWNPSIASLSTYLYRGLRFFLDEFYEGRYLLKKRYEGRTISLQTFMASSDERKSDTLVMADMLGDQQAPEKIIRDCYVADIIKGIYDGGSSNLQFEIKRWFLGGLERLRTNSTSFRKASEEFRQAASEKHLHYEEARHLMRSPECLDKLSRGIRAVPFDLENPTPSIRYHA